MKKIATLIPGFVFVYMVNAFAMKQFDNYDNNFEIGMFVAILAGSTTLLLSYYELIDRVLVILIGVVSLVPLIPAVIIEYPLKNAPLFSLSSGLMLFPIIEEYFG